jgi:hypothetical protein
VPYSEKMHRLGPQNGLGSSGIEKVLKIVSCQKTKLSQLKMVGGHRDPLDQEAFNNLILEKFSSKNKFILIMICYFIGSNNGQALESSMYPIMMQERLFGYSFLLQSSRI